MRLDYSTPSTALNFFTMFVLQALIGFGLASKHLDEETFMMDE